MPAARGTSSDKTPKTAPSAGSRLGTNADQAKDKLDTDAQIRKRFLLTCAVFAPQARAEGRWLEFLSHVFSRFWLLWPEPMLKTVDELEARVKASKAVSLLPPIASNQSDVLTYGVNLHPGPRASRTSCDGRSCR